MVRVYVASHSLALYFDFNFESNLVSHRVFFAFLQILYKFNIVCKNSQILII